MSEYSEIQNKIENGSNNSDVNNKYYVSEAEMAMLIDSMVSYENEDDMESKPIFKHDMIAANNERIIIQQKCPFDEKECSICLTTLFHKQVAYLPCKHYFHSSCLTEAFNNRLYTCPLCRTDLNKVLNKIGFKFPPAEPEQITDLDLDLIYRLIESSVYYPFGDDNAVGDANPVGDANAVGDANPVGNANAVGDANPVGDYPLLYFYRLEFNIDDIEQMMGIIDSVYGNSSDNGGGVGGGIGGGVGE